MRALLSRHAPACLAALLLLAGCALPRPGGQDSAASGLSRVAYSALPGWSVNEAVAGLPAFQRSCKVISVMPVDQALGGAGLADTLGGKAGDWRAACAAATSVPPDDAAAAQSFFQTWLVPYAASGTTRITGYYEPVYPGSEIREDGYVVPIYARPRDLVDANLSAFRDTTGKRRIVGRLRYGTMVPYYSRAQIEGGAIRRLAKVVAWVKNPVDAYMIQLQGAARLRLPDGTLIDLGFDGTNGRVYTPIGKLMVEKGYLKPDDVSITSIRAWLLAHPTAARGLMDANRNYVFFKRIRGVPDGLGTPGALDVPLAPEGSAAVDAKTIPLGAPVFIATKTLARLTTAQDVDVGAHGTSALQIFFGLGSKAAARASAEAETGRIFVLLPRQAATSSSAKGASS